MKNQRLLGDVLDCLLPAVDELAGAGSLGLADSVLSDPLLAAEPGAIDKVLDALPEDFTDLDPRGKNKSLRLAQKLNPDAFGILISVAYNAYYVDPRVLARINHLTEYKAGAPQPDGYEVEIFDESVLTQIRERNPFWRKVNL